MYKTNGIGVAILFVVFFLLALPLVAGTKTFDNKQLTRQITAEIKVAQILKHPLLTKGVFDYLSQDENPAETDTNLSCKDRISDESELAEIAAEVAAAPAEKMPELKAKYHCYSFDILNYFIGKHQNEALKRALDGGFDEHFILLNQAVFAENKEALNLLSSRGYMYLALMNFISQNNTVLNLEREIKKRAFRYKNRAGNANDLVRAVLHNNRYDLIAANKFIPPKLRQREYLKALNTLIYIRSVAKKY